MNGWKEWKPSMKNKVCMLTEERRWRLYLCGSFRQDETWTFIVVHAYFWMFKLPEEMAICQLGVILYVGSILDYLRRDPCLLKSIGYFLGVKFSRPLSYFVI